MGSADQQTFYFADFQLAANTAALWRCREIVSLEPQACRVLLYLVANHQRLVTKEELLENVWRDVFTTDDVLKKAVSQIRRTLADDADNPRFIQTLHRRGYRFIAEVSATPVNGEQSFNGLQPAQEFENTNSGKTIAAITDGDPDFDQLVGREVETDLLHAEFRRTLRGQGQPILITGDPGAGKTQLATRFARWASGQGAVCLRARFFDYEAARVSSYDLFLDLIYEALTKLSPENAAKRADLRRMIEAHTTLVLPEELFTTTISAKRLNRQSDAFRLIAPLAECFLRLSEKQPLILIFDDLQWADDTSLEIIGYLMRAASDAARVMLIATARRAETENTSHQISVWLQAQAVYRSYTSLKLAPLTVTEYRQLITEIFKYKLEATEISAGDLRQLHLTTGGNPYFLVETLRMLIAENAIEKLITANDDSLFLWRWRGLKDVPLPETVRMAARSKLARLNPQTRDYVERAAVLGDAFQLETLEQMFDAGQLSEMDFESYQSQAVTAQVLTEQAVSGTDDCQFYHTTLRRAVYDDLSPRRRKRLHARAAAALKLAYRHDIDRVAAALGAHYEAAGNFDLSFEHNLRASELANRRFDWTEAAECAERANRAAEFIKKETATQISDENQIRLLLASGEALLSTGKRIEAESAVSKAIALAESTNNTVLLLAAALGMKAHTQVLLGCYRESLVSSQKALQLARETNNRPELANALLQIASAQYALCEYEKACQALQTVIDEFGSENYYSAVALGKLGWVRALQSRYAEAKLLLAQALAFHHNAGDVRQRIVLALCLDWAEHGAGNYETAIKFAAQARDQAHNIGELYSELIATMRIGKSRLAQGLFAEAEIILKTALSKLAEKNAVHSEAETLWFLGRARSLQNSFAEAAPLFERALKAIRAIGDREDEFRILIDVAQLQIGQTNACAALETAEQAAQIAEELNIPDGIGAALITQSAAQLALNQPIAARQTAERAIELLELAGAGERWRGYVALADALSALLQNAANPEIERNALESALRRALELLSVIREQFDRADIDRRTIFTRTHQQPAHALRALLIATNRLSEADVLSRAWQLDLDS